MNLSMGRKEKIFLAFYRSFSSIFVYIGVIALAGYYLFAHTSEPFLGLNLAISTYFDYLYASSNQIIFLILAHVVTIIGGLAYVIGGYFSKRGYLTSLLISSGAYLLDLVLLVVIYNFKYITLSNFISSLIVHSAFLLMMLFAIYAFIFLYRHGLAEKSNLEGK